MKIHTRLLALCLALSFLLLAAGCGATDDPQPSGTGEPAPGLSASSGETEASTAATTEPTEPPTWPTYPDDRQITAQQTFVYDCSTGEFLQMTGSETDRVYLASITKLFTAHVALQYLDPTTPVTVGSELDLVIWGSSVADLERGNVLTVEQLIEAMLLPSGNDAAYTLAVAAGRAIEGDDTLSASAAVNVFVAQMNQEARNQGMLNTHFVNPDGIHDSEHYSSMADLAILGQLSLESPTIVKYAQTARDMVTPVSGNSFAWQNTNALVDPSSEYYCPVALGLKTGQTPSAGSCLLSAFQLEDRQIIIGVFGCPEAEDRFADTLQLLQLCLD